MAYIAYMAYMAYWAIGPVLYSTGPASQPASQPVLYSALYSTGPMAHSAIYTGWPWPTVQYTLAGLCPSILSGQIRHPDMESSSPIDRAFLKTPVFSMKSFRARACTRALAQRARAGFQCILHWPRPENPLNSPISGVQWVSPWAQPIP